MDLDWFGDVVVHACGQAPLALARHCVGGHRDDRHVPAASLVVADLPGRLVAVHLRHVAVDQQRVIVAAADHGHGFRPRAGDVGSITQALDHSQRHLLVGRVVVDHKHTSAIAPQRGRMRRRFGAAATWTIREDRLQHVEKLRRTDGFDHLRVDPRYVLLRLSGGREEDDGDVADGLVRPHRRRDGGAIHLGHHQVDDRDLKRGLATRCASDLAQRLVAGIKASAMHAPRRHVPLEDCPVGPVVVDDRHGHPGQRCARPRRMDLLSGLAEERAEPELAALAFLALDADFASHQLDEHAGDRQAESRAAVAARGRAVELGVDGEDSRRIFSGQADARVRDFEADADAGTLDLEMVRADDHLPRIGEFHGVADEVDQHLAQPAGVTHHELGHVWTHVQDQLDAFVGRGFRKKLDRFFDDVARAEIDCLQLYAPGLDTREIEDVVDDLEQCIAGSADRLDVLALLGRELSVHQQAGHPDDTAERSADLVAHRGEELRLEPRQLLQVLVAD